ncbi:MULTISPECIES: hypothetical protein [unclassified Sphingobacterium]|uniref:hypothetical protein n=1 Tax=unclassified Sphingobacterium TaxID=2609468 RepID=UPI0025E39ADD|nr:MULTISPECIES: hypothetical protein [unclassified Sphingobacterium]
MNQIPNNIADLTKEIINERLSHFNYIALNNYYTAKTGDLIILSAISETTTSVHIEVINRGKDKILIYFLPRPDFSNFPEAFELFKKLILDAWILKDKNLLLTNLKVSCQYLFERNSVKCDFAHYEKMKWEISVLLEELRIIDSIHIRFKILEKLVSVFDKKIPDFFIPVFIEMTPNKTPLTHLINRLGTLSCLEFCEEIYSLLLPFGGRPYLLEPNVQYIDGLSIVINSGEVDLNVFLTSIYLNVLNEIKRFTYYIEGFYWERTENRKYTLSIIMGSHSEQKQDLKTILELKFNPSQMKILAFKAHTIYDVLNPYYQRTINRLSSYLLDLKFNEDLELNESIMLSYAIEFYISASLKIGLSRDDFFNLNRGIAKKWNLLVMNTDDFFEEDYVAINIMYEKFDRTYQLTENSISYNFGRKLEEWSNLDDSFDSEITVMISDYERLKTDKYFLNILRLLFPHNNNTGNNNRFIFMEGLFYKCFGTFGLSIEMKLYVVYLVNRLANDY